MRIRKPFLITITFQCVLAFGAVNAAVYGVVRAAVIVPQAGEETKGAYSSLWNSSDLCQQPESVYFDTQSKAIFVSNVVGDPTVKDGQGWIHRLNHQGKNIQSKWISGLNAPKGMRSHKGTLWVSDIDEVIAINIQTGKIEKKISVAGSKFLNDVAIDNSGIVYVSDTLGSKIFQIKGDKVSTFAEGTSLEAPNGLLVVGKELVVAAWGIPEKDWTTKTPGSLYKIHLTTKKQITIASHVGNLDGLEIDNGSYLVSDWNAGKVMRISSQGKVTDLFVNMKGAADIGYLATSRTLVIPRMGENIVTAYDLNHFPKH